LGVIDFINKPFSAPVLLNRMKTHLNIDELIRDRTTQLQKKTDQLQHLQNGLVYVLGDMVENRDQNTGGHIERTTAYIQILVSAMQSNGVYSDEVDSFDFEHFISPGRLHDIGKISIPDAVLNKPGKLTDEEFEIMKTHTTEGVRIIKQIVDRTEEYEIDDMEFLKNAFLFAGYHHERWDGKGYPYALAGTNIPLLGRIMAFADVYDALVTERPYKKAFTPEEAVDIIMSGAGKQFDPLISEVFFKVKDQFKEAYYKYA
jgi:putative two-component system response regulator